jgi:hypothetical protein
VPNIGDYLFDFGWDEMEKSDKKSNISEENIDVSIKFN